MEDLPPKILLYFFGNEPRKDRGSGSGYMRLNQTHEVLYNKSLLKNVNMRFTTSVKGIHDCYILFCKDNHQLNESMLAEAKQNNNTIIFDILDYYDVKTSLTPDIVKNGFVKHIDIFLVNNEYMKREYEEKFKKPTFIVYHHYDIRLIDIKLKKNEKLTFIFNGYIGDKERNCLYIKEMRKDYGLIVNEFFLNFYNKLLASNYCFVSIRKEGSWEFNNRPLMKLAHAAACDSNIIITNDMSVRDLLDPSYPYLLKDDKYETVCEMIEYVKKTYNTEVWFQGLDIMKGLKEKLRIENVVKDYWVPMFKRVFQREKIIFISTFIGPKSLLDIADKFKKVENARYLFFTNLEKSDILNEQWEVITIDPDFLRKLREETREDCVKMSRYFKFNVFSYLSTYLNIELKDKFIFYCDSYLFPKDRKNWNELCEKFKNCPVPIIQYEHHRKKGGIQLDLACIHKGKKDSLANINALEKYLIKINSSVNLSIPQYYENTVLGFYVNEKVIELCKKFWKLYLDSPSYRDQPLWNFIYLNENCKPFVDNNFRNNFKGEKHIERHIQEYENAKL